MYKNLIFDFFDVIHSDPLKRWLSKYGLAREGEIAEASRMLDKGHLSMDEFFQRLAEHSHQKPAEIAGIFGDTQMIDNDMVSLIDQLHARYQIGLLSNSRGDYIRPILEEHAIGHLFDEVVISAEVGMIKPHSEIFEFTLDKMNAKPEETVFIDDSEHNVEAARAIGIRGIVFKNVDDLKEKLAGLGISG
jgi:putative hydrolase of the HAD superfamily